MAQDNYQKYGGNREGDEMKDSTNSDEAEEGARGGLLEHVPQGTILGEDLPKVDAIDRGKMLGSDYNVDLSSDATNRIGGLDRFTGSDPVDACYPKGDCRDEGSHMPQYKGGA